MIVDWHSHVYPPEIAKKRGWGTDSPFTIEKLLEAHERAGIDLCVVSNTMHPLKDKSRDEALSFIKRWNQYAAEIQGKYSDRIVAFTSTIPGAGKEFLREVERAIVEYGLKGIF
ncbi:MAG: hypothetical protein E6J89_11625, partial [Deltaproteobacteria bacterium]